MVGADRRRRGLLALRRRAARPRREAGRRPTPTRAAVECRLLPLGERPERAARLARRPRRGSRRTPATCVATSPASTPPSASPRSPRAPASASPQLPDGQLHEAILAAMGALYLIHEEAWRPGREPISLAVYSALGPLARPSLAVHLLRRGGRGSRALLTARGAPAPACEIHSAGESDAGSAEERSAASVRRCSTSAPSVATRSSSSSTCSSAPRSTRRRSTATTPISTPASPPSSARSTTSSSPAPRRRSPGESGWRDRMRATAYALLRFLRRDERVARLAAVEVQYAGKRAQELFLETFNRLVNLLDEGSSEADGPESPGLATAIGVGGVVFARVQEAVAQGGTGAGGGGDPGADVRGGVPLPRRRGRRGGAPHPAAPDPASLALRGGARRSRPPGRARARRSVTRVM